MAKYLFADDCVICHRTEIISVDHEAVLGGAAKETAVEACLAELEEKQVVSVFVDGNDITSRLFTEKERVETNLTRGENIISPRCGELQNREKKASDADGIGGNYKAAVL